jgi:hypothetical protein
VAGYSRIADVRRLLNPRGFLTTVGGALVFVDAVGFLAPVGAQRTEGHLGTALGVAMVLAGLFLPARLDRLIVALFGVVALYVEFLYVSAGLFGAEVASTSDHLTQVAIAGPALLIAISGGFAEH